MFIAVIILTSTIRVSLPPILLTQPSCITLKSFACRGKSIEFISSKNRVPPSANSKSPGESLDPVKLPTAVPKSILSNNVTGIAAQFCAIKGLLHLSL